MKHAGPTKVYQILSNYPDLFCRAILSQASKSNLITAVLLLQTNALTHLKQKSKLNTYVFVFPKSSPRLRYHICLVFFNLTIILLYTVLDYLTSPINI